MAKYYLNRSRSFGGDTEDVYEAVSEKPQALKYLTDGVEEKKDVYPTARLTVHTERAKTSPNWSFRKEPSNWGRENFPDQVDLVDKEVGMPNLEAHLSGPLRNIHETTLYAADSLINEKDILPREHRRDYGLEYARGIRDLKKGTSELFSSTPSKSTVTGAFSHTRMRHTIPIMAAMAHQQWGNLTASYDLSEHSSRMVKKAKEMNLPINTSVENPRAEITNDYTFHDLDNIRYDSPVPRDMDTREIPAKKVESAKKYYKEMRGFGKSRSGGQSSGGTADQKMGPQFIQMRLPGMENQ